MASQRATVTHRNMAYPPDVSEGEITPELVCAFEYHANVFFLNAKGGIEEDQKVSRILGCFHDSRVRNWAICEEARLKALSFDEFLTALRRRWLDPDWEYALVMQILGSRLNPAKEEFETWAVRIQKLNVTLRGTTSRLSDSQLRFQLEAALDEDLRILAAEEKANKIKGLRPWIEKVSNIDRRRRREATEQFLRDPERLYGSRRNRLSLSRANTTEATTTNSYPPRLTPEERRC
jgi:hypothetical protein